MKTQIEAWERLPTQEMTYEWLREALCREIANKREKKHRGQTQEALSKNPGEQQLIPAVPAVPDAKRKARGKGKANAKAKAKAKAKSAPAGSCSDFDFNGVCKFGDKCRDSHAQRAGGNPALALPAAASSGGGGVLIAERPCWNWLAGDCHFGAQCRFKRGPKL